MTQRTEESYTQDPEGNPFTEKPKEDPINGDYQEPQDPQLVLRIMGINFHLKILVLETLVLKLKGFSRKH